MNITCRTCHHQSASHQQWGQGPCDARGCTCIEYVKPQLFADPYFVPGYDDMTPDEWASYLTGGAE